jgi:hypothetical protein
MIKMIPRGLKWLGVLLLLTQGVSVRSASSTDVPFNLHAGLIWVQVDRPGCGRPLNFILDSGAEVSAIDLATVLRLHLDLGQPITIRGVSGTTGGYWPEYLPARMGGISLPTNYLAMDLSAVGDACHRKVDGLIGADFFAGRVVQIDFAKEKIRLLENCKPGANAQILPLQIEASRLRVPVDVLGIGNAWARLDTGCASALHWAVSASEVTEAGSSQELGVGVSSALIRQNTKSVRLGNLTVKNVSTGMHTEKLLANESGLLGDGLLSQFSLVTIDEPGKQLVLDGYLSYKLTSPKFSGLHR